LRYIPGLWIRSWTKASLNGSRSTAAAFGMLLVILALFALLLVRLQRNPTAKSGFGAIKAVADAMGCGVAFQIMSCLGINRENTSEKNDVY
jgi:hypothetical protein